MKYSIYRLARDNWQHAIDIESPCTLMPKGNAVIEWIDQNAEYDATRVFVKDLKQVDRERYSSDSLPPTYWLSDKTTDTPYQISLRSQSVTLWQLIEETEREIVNA